MALVLERPALFIVDMQVGFVAETGAYARVGRSLRAGPTLLESIRRLLQEFRDRDLPRYFTAYRYRADGSDYPARRHLVVPNAYLGRSEPFFVPGARETEIVSELAPREDEPVIFKNRYSAFFGTDLDARLLRAGVRSVVMTGVLSHVCVEATARDAFARDLDVVVVEDAVAGTDEALHRAALRNLADTVGAVVDSEELLRALPARANA